MQPMNFAEKHPYRFTTLMVLSVIVVYFLSGMTTAILKLPGIDLYLIANIGLAILAAGLLTRLRWWKRAGFRALATPLDLRLYWLPIIPALANLVFGFSTLNLHNAAFYFILSGLVGFAEEAIFRGLVLSALLPKGTWRAVIISSLVFGALHSMNAIGGQNGIYTLLQMGYALMIGFGFAAVTMRSRALWPLVIVHTLIDFASYLVSGGVGSTQVTTLDMALSAVYIAAFLAYGLFLLRPSAKAQPILTLERNTQ